MLIWVDAQLPPAIADWLSTRFAVQAHAIRDVGLRDADDLTIFRAARQAGAIVMTKDRDFVELVQRLGPPPQVLWIAFGNTRNTRLKEILDALWPQARRHLQDGEPLVELSGINS